VSIATRPPRALRVPLHLAPKSRSRSARRLHPCTQGRQQDSRQASRLTPGNKKGRSDKAQATPSPVSVPISALYLCPCPLPPGHLERQHPAVSAADPYARNASRPHRARAHTHTHTHTYTHIHTPRSSRSRWPSRVRCLHPHPGAPCLHQPQVATWKGQQERNNTTRARQHASS